MKPLPDKNRLKVMWAVAVTSALAGQGESHEIFAGMLYRYITKTEHPVTMKPLPDKNRLDLMWRVSVSSMLSHQGESHEIFAGMLYRYLTDTEHPVTLKEQ